MKISGIEQFIEQAKQTHREEQLASGQMTLGRFIEALEALPGDKPIIFDSTNSPGEPLSYRGYYEQLAFSDDEGNPRITVNEVLKYARSAIGRTLDGYKGGDFIMHEHTFVWAAQYGRCGRKIMGIKEGREGFVIMTATEEP